MDFCGHIRSFRSMGGNGLYLWKGMGDGFWLVLADVFDVLDMFDMKAPE